MTVAYADQVKAAVIALQRGWFTTLEGVCQALDVHPIEVRARLDDATATRLGLRTTMKEAA